MSKATAVAERTADQLPGDQGQPQPVTILDIINRAAFDPSVDADKVKTLLQLAREFRADDAKAAYTRDMLKVKLELPIVDRKGLIEVRKKTSTGERDGDVQQSTKFARWEDIDAAITPILNKHGFALTFRTGNLPDGKVTVTGVLSHKDGHSEESMMALPLDTSGSKNNVQAAGSSTSYGKRYTATALLNIRTNGEDDDGHEGGTPGKVTADQQEKIRDLIDMTGADIERFCQFMGVNSIADISTKDFEKAIVALNTKAKATQKAAS